MSTTDKRLPSAANLPSPAVGWTVLTMIPTLMRIGRHDALAIIENAGFAGNALRRCWFDEGMLKRRSGFNGVRNQVKL